MRLAAHARRIRRLFAVGALSATVCLPASAFSQTVTVDEGRFTISRAGVLIGREEFSIRRTPGVDMSMVYVASGTATYGDRRVTSALRTGTTGAPLAYEAEVRIGKTSLQKVRGQFGRGRFGSISRTANGEMSREDVVGPGVVVVDDELFHQHYFVTLDRTGGATSLIVPRRSLRLGSVLERVGADSVDVAGRALAATHYRLRGASERDLWIDERGRVMKVALPGGVIALRDEPPR